MPAVVSFGSVNVDRTGTLSADAVETLADQHDWFPAPGETVAVGAVPDDIEAYLEATFIGGKGANQSVAAAAAGAETAFYGKIGVDAEDHAVLSTLADRGVVVDGVGRADCETGKAYVFLTDGSDSRIAIVEGANGRVDEAYVSRRLGAVANADCLLLQNEIPTTAGVTLLDHLADSPGGPTVILDPAPVADVEPLIRHGAVDIVIPNAYEANAVAGPLETFEGTVVQTNGPDPVVVSPVDGRGFEVSPPPVTPVDTTGAGDVFNGYLGARIAAGAALEQAVRTATTAAALATTTEGAQRAIPTLAATRERMH